MKLIMYVYLSCSIIIGNLVFDHCNKVRIEKSTKSLSQRADIIMPSKYYLNDDVTKLSEQIKEGDRVEISLGYNGSNKLEYSGFVSSISPELPLKITCDDMYELKRAAALTKSWQSVKLADVFKTLVPEIELNVQDISLSPFYIDRANIYKVLEDLQSNFGLAIYYRNNKLFAGLPYTDPHYINSDNIIYWKNNNIPEQTNLTYKKKENIKLKIKGISILPNNTRLEYEAGDDGGETRTETYYNISLAELKTEVDNSLNNKKYTGYEGSIKTLGQPFVDPGMVAEYYDDDNKDKEGKFLIDKVITEFGIGHGFQRSVYIDKEI